MNAPVYVHEFRLTDAHDLHFLPIIDSLKINTQRK